MRPTTRELLDSIVTALEREVAPSVQDKWVASTLRSAVQLLNHIAVRTEDEGRVLIEDNQDARRVLEAIRPRLSSESDGVQLSAVIDQALHLVDPAPYDTVGLDARNEAYQVAIEHLVRHKDRLRRVSGDTSAHDELRRYLMRRLKREQHLIFPVFTGPPF